MSLRRLLAPGLLGFHRALSALGSSPAGAVRILVMHDVPEAWDAAFVQLRHHSSFPHGEQNILNSAVRELRDRITRTLDIGQ